MSLRKLYERFQGVSDLPIEIADIRDAVIQLGVQDRIIFRGESLDPGELCGIFYQYITRPGVYADPVLTTIIVYPESAEPAVQRMISAKELIHMMDSALERVETQEGLTELVDKLLGPLSTEDFGLADYVAAQDKMAIYRCIPLLFPSAARAVASQLLKEGAVTIAQIAEWACLPDQIVTFVMADGWPELEKSILDC
jgi:hypothetical protein